MRISSSSYSSSAPLAGISSKAPIIQQVGSWRVTTAVSSYTVFSRSISFSILIRLELLSLLSFGFPPMSEQYVNRLYLHETYFLNHQRCQFAFYVSTYEIDPDIASHTSQYHILACQTRYPSHAFCNRPFLKERDIIASFAISRSFQPQFSCHST